MKLHIVDTTLRDGEQTPGVAFTSDAKIEIAKALCDLGVDIIEVGIPIMGQEEVRAIGRVAELNLKSTLLTWNRLNTKDIDASLQTGVKNVHISVPSSFIQIDKKLRKTSDEVLLEVGHVVEYSIKKGCTVSLGAEDASRADENFLLKLYHVALDAGASRLRYADTLGKLNPFDTLRIIQSIKDKLNSELDFHGHNDFGMATANALAAFKGGAHFISCSVNGLGERAGNTPLEEIVMALYYMEKCETTIQIDKLIPISKLVESYSGRITNPGKPIVGEEVFSHESGIHVDGLMKDIHTYQYLDPVLLGRTNQFVLGKHSGRSIYKWMIKN
ncbi:MAG: homocitrate synthase/isopropylmalate synthase family protein [Eubacteriales bacterium]